MAPHLTLCTLTMALLVMYGAHYLLRLTICGSRVPQRNRWPDVKLAEARTAIEQQLIRIVVVSPMSWAGFLSCDNMVMMQSPPYITELILVVAEVSLLASSNPENEKNTYCFVPLERNQIVYDGMNVSLDELDEEYESWEEMLELYEDEGFMSWERLKRELEKCFELFETGKIDDSENDEDDEAEDDEDDDADGY